MVALRPKNRLCSERYVWLRPHPYCVCV
ncbi:hypothetical protein M3J09_008293 [Ascochyta lentis]